MSCKIAILFTVLAITHIASGTAGTGSPSSAYSVAVGNVFTNATDSAFTNLQADCTFTAGFDNTTNYVWCVTNSKTQTVATHENVATYWSIATGTASTDIPSTTTALVLERRAINASSPSTKNATLDTKITTTIQANDGGMFCAGVGYLGIAYSYGSGTTGATLQSDVSLAYIAVNGTTATTVKLTSSGSTVRSKVQACMFDNGIFYVVYTQDAASQDTPDQSKNAVMIQGVNVTSGAVYYNSTGGVSVITPSTTVALPYSQYGLIATNWTGYGSTIGLLGYKDTTGTASASGCPATHTAGNCASTGATYKVVPITLATGAPGTAVSAGTSGVSTVVTISTDTKTATTSTITTTYGIAGGFGSLSSYGWVATKSVQTVLTGSLVADDSAVASVASTATVYTSSMFLNGSSSASTSFNMTNPTGFHLQMLTGYSTSDGFGLISTYQPDSATATSFQVNKDTYYANGTAILSAVSLGTFDNGVTSGSSTDVQTWIDAVGSPWLGYILSDTAAAWTGLSLLSGYAGEIAYNPLGANALTSICATLILMIAALFAF